MAEKKDVFALTIEKLLAEAKKDGIVSDEEMEIIKQVEVDADSYNMILQASLDDGIIDEEESEMLADIKRIIMERAEIVANIDDEFSPDEKNMITKLSEILAEHYRTK